MLLGIKERAERAREEAGEGMTETSELALYLFNFVLGVCVEAGGVGSYSYYPLGSDRDRPFTLDRVDDSRPA